MSFRSSLQIHSLWVTLYSRSLKFLLTVSDMFEVHDDLLNFKFYENYLFTRNKTEEIRFKVFTSFYFDETVKTRFKPELRKLYVIITIAWSRFQLRTLLISVIPPLLKALQDVCMLVRKNLPVFWRQFLI